MTIQELIDKLQQSIDREHAHPQDVVMVSDLAFGTSTEVTSVECFNIGEIYLNINEV